MKLLTPMILRFTALTAMGINKELSGTVRFVNHSIPPVVNSE